MATRFFLFIFAALSLFMASCDKDSDFLSEKDLDTYADSPAALDIPTTPIETIEDLTKTYVAPEISPLDQTTISLNNNPIANFDPRWSSNTSYGSIGFYCKGLFAKNAQIKIKII
ncbi:MAG: hypothetical protein AAF849_12800 [Bacteroidota bacterium]